MENRDSANLLQHREEFETIYGIISAHKKRAMNAMHNESLNMLWEVGAYVSDRLKKAVWGDGVVRMLAEYIHTRSPKAKGWSYSTIYRMVRFYDTYSSDGFTQTVSRYGMQNYLTGTKQKKLPSQDSKFVSFEMTQIDSAEIVSFRMAQIPSVLFSTGWTNHQIIMNRCKTDAERLFYMLYAGKEQLENKELVRVIKTNTMTSLLGSKDVQSEMMKREYPQSGVLFKDTVYLEMFGLPVKYKESKLRKEIIAHMKDFILEMGKDFLFIDDEHRIAVGGKTFKSDKGTDPLTRSTQS